MLGPNGAGKSTLLRAIAGLEELSTRRGRRRRARLAAARAVRCPPSSAGPGVVFQDYRLFPHLDVRDNVAFAARSARRRPGGVAGAGAAPGSTGSASPSSRAAGRASSPAVSPSGWRWPARWPLEPRGAAARRADGRAGRRRPDRRPRVPARAPRGLRRSGRAGHPRPARGDGAGRPAGGARGRSGRCSRALRPRWPADRASSYVARLVGLNLLAGTRSARAVPSTWTEAAGSPCDRGRRPGPVLVSLRPSAITVHTGHPEHSQHPQRLAGRVAADGGAGRPGAAPGGGVRRRRWSTSRPAAVAELGARRGPRRVALGQGHRGRGVRRSGIASTRSSDPEVLGRQPSSSAPVARGSDAIIRVSRTQESGNDPLGSTRGNARDAHPVSVRTARPPSARWRRSCTPASPTTPSTRRVCRSAVAARRRLRPRLADAAPARPGRHRGRLRRRRRDASTRSRRRSARARASTPSTTTEPDQHICTDLTERQPVAAARRADPGARPTSRGMAGFRLRQDGHAGRRAQRVQRHRRCPHRALPRAGDHAHRLRLGHPRRPRARARRPPPCAAGWRATARSARPSAC